MRLRKVKNALEILEKEPNIVFIDPKINKGKWINIFNNDNPIYLEVGCGKGKFVMGMAEAYPDINFIAMEKFDSVLIRTLELYNTKKLPNVRLILGDASLLLEYFECEEIKQLFLNFSDPWPKERHAKRRLTSPLFLDIYKKLLPKGSKIIQKTDNKDLFAYSIKTYSQNNFIITDISLDLHSELTRFNVRTEFEDKWSPKGPIYFVEVVTPNE